jgi:hypothetical protein
MKLNTSFRTSSIPPPPPPRSTPSSGIPQSLPPHETWNGAYTPVSSAIERSPSIADVSPVTSSMRWTPAHHQLSPPSTESERMMHHPIEQSIDPAVQQPVSYPYMVNNSGPPVHYQGETSIVTYPTTSSAPPQMPDYHPRQSGAQMAPSPAYPPFPTHQDYIAPSPHEEHGIPMMQGQHQHLLYSMPPHMKPEH